MRAFFGRNVSRLHNGRAVQRAVDGHRGLQVLNATEALVDILPVADNKHESRLSDVTEGVAGKLPPFEELHGFSIDGVDLMTAILPASWRDQLVKIQVKLAPLAVRSTAARSHVGERCPDHLPTRRAFNWAVRTQTPTV